MINFSLLGLGVMCSQSMNELLQVTNYIQESANPTEPVGVMKSNQIRNWLELWKDEAQTLEWDSVVTTIEQLEFLLDNNATYQDLEYGLSNIKEQIDCSLNYQYLFRYSKKCIASLQNWKKDWEDVLKKFPNTSEDIYAGIDLCCLGHSTSSVFHMMRVFENGLKGLANSLDVPEDANILGALKDQIEEEISIEQAKRKSAKKSNRLEFLCNLAKEIRFLEERWENYTSRKTCQYESVDAQSVIEHTKLIMLVLSENLVGQDLAKARAA